MSYSVYKHTFPNGKVYIGITSLQPEKRWIKGKGYKTQSLIYNAINKYGWSNIKHEILYSELTKKEAEQKEIELILFYKSNDSEFGYNIANGGNSQGMHSELSKSKMSESSKGKNNPMYGKFGNDNPNYGKTRTLEQCERIRESLIGHATSEDTKHKISDALKKYYTNNDGYWKGKHLSQESKQKIKNARLGSHLSDESKKKISNAFSGENHPMYGKHHSDETKEKIRNSKKHTPVICIETNIIYRGQKEASRKTGVDQSSIWKCCNGKAKTAGGYHWEYVEKDIERSA